MEDKGDENKQNKGSIKAFTDKEKHYKHGGNKAIWRHQAIRYHFQFKEKRIFD